MKPFSGRVKAPSIAGLLLAGASFSALAVSWVEPVVSSTEISETRLRAYAGLNWQLGGGSVPLLVLGAFSTTVKSDGQTRGAHLALYLDPRSGLAPARFSVGYLDGRPTLQGEFAIGYDLTRRAPFVGLGANGAHAALAVDAYFGPPAWRPGLSLHSQGAFKQPAAANNYQCGPLYRLVDTHCVSDLP